MSSLVSIKDADVRQNGGNAPYLGNALTGT